MEILAVCPKAFRLRLWFKKSRGKKAMIGETRTRTDGMTYRKYGADDWRPVTAQDGLFGGGGIIPKKTATSKENYSSLKPRVGDVEAARGKKTK